MSTTFEAFAPANIVDLAACAGVCRKVVWNVMCHQLQLGESWAVRGSDGRAVAVLGYVPHDTDVKAGEAEAWLCLSADARHCVISIVRALRLTLDQVPYSSIYAVIVTPEGQRIARLAGFVMDENVNGLEIWSCQR